MNLLRSVGCILVRNSIWSVYMGVIFTITYFHVICVKLWPFFGRELLFLRACLIFLPLFLFSKSLALRSKLDLFVTKEWGEMEMLVLVFHVFALLGRLVNRFILSPSSILLLDCILIDFDFSSYFSLPFRRWALYYEVIFVHLIRWYELLEIFN